MTGAERVALGLVHQGAGRLREAEALYREVLAEDPRNIDALHFLGVIALQRGNAAQAAELISRALSHNPANAPACNNLGLALAALDRRADAVRAVLRAIALQPGYPDALANLQRFLAGRRPDSEEEKDALMVLGDAHSRANRLDEAAECMQRILAADPADSGAHNLLANIRRNQARHAEALRHYALAIAHAPEPMVAFQNLLFCMMCMPEFSAADICAKHREFARRFEQPLLATRPAFANTRDPRRRLKVGYVSPDFRANVVGHYLQPILEHHDRGAFEVHGYFIGAATDGVTERIAALVDHWHDARGLSDEDLAALVRSHQIDILVDLCGHGPGNRILAFARRPAPVQVNYLDYSATTGLASMDYRLSTEYCDPTGSADRYYSEKLLRLPAAYWTYNPPIRLPIEAPPFQAKGHITFGSFNLYYRITTEVVDLWARLLREVPRSRLVIVSVAPGSTQAALLERLEEADVAPERIDVHGVVSYPAYHELIAGVDIALAPFPYNGATTLMDCLWNGVPVVAMTGGETFTTRLGCSVLAALGLQQLIAADADEYVRIAGALATTPAELSELRGTLRSRLERSPMRDFAGFTSALESAYRAAWQAWCAG